jgi:hypothetical protein
MSLPVIYPCGCSSHDPPYTFDVGDIVQVTCTTHKCYGMIVGTACRRVGYTVLLSQRSPYGQVLLGSVWDHGMEKVPARDAPQFEGQFPECYWECKDPLDVEGSSVPPSDILNASDSDAADKRRRLNEPAALDGAGGSGGGAGAARD